MPNHSRTVVVSPVGPSIVKITLNRPRSLNAINVDLLNDLTESIRKCADHHVIILEGAGDRSFCAGEDLKETLAPSTGSAEELQVSFQRLQDITRLTSSAKAIVISAVQGFAIGGGAEIALAADFVIGGPQAQFKFPEASIGHAVTGGISLRLPLMVGVLTAKELLITGRFVGAEEALRIGLLSEIAKDPKARSVELAQELARLPRIASSASKTSLERAVFPYLENVLHDEVNVASYCFAQSDAAKAFSDFSTRNGKATPANNRESIKDINTALAIAVKKRPDKTFLRFGSQDVTFWQFDRGVAALAGGLRAAGIGPGNRLLVMMRNSLEMVHTWLAANRLGATWVPINVELKNLTLQNVVQAAQATVAIVDREFYSELLSLGIIPPQSIYIKDVKKEHDIFSTLDLLYVNEAAVHEAVSVTPGTTSAFLYTSGTTGKSKPCVLSHHYFILQASALIDSFGLVTDDVLYCPFPLFHADATALTVIPALLLGATAALSARFSVRNFWAEIRDTRATVYDFMGATLALTYKQPASPQDRDHNVRLAWGVPIPSFATEYEQRFGHPLYTLYGSVEASIPIVQQGPTRVSGSCGRLRAGHQLRIVDDDGDDVTVGTAGHLLLRADEPRAFFAGYFADSVNTARAFSQLWLHTGDLARVDEQGNVFFVGRTKDVIRRRGENINAEEIEEELLRHPDVAVAAAFAVASELDAGAEEEVKVAVQLCDGATCDEEDLWRWMTQNLARFQVPRVVEIVNEIPSTPTGKMDKGALSRAGGKVFDNRRI